MPYRYPTQLPEGISRDPWESWPTFASYVTGATDARLCQVVHAIKPKTARGRLAWPTLVIGSECLRVRNPQTDRAIELLPDALRNELAEVLATIEARAERPGPGVAAEDSWLDGVVGFVDQLVGDRLGLPFRNTSDDAAPEPGPDRVGAEPVFVADPFHPEDGDAERPGPLSAADENRARWMANQKSEQFNGWELRLIIAAASLTQHYFKGKLETTKSVSRWAQETLTMSQVYEPYSSRSVAALSALQLELDRLSPKERQDTQQIRAVAETMRDSLMPEARRETISLAHLQALTEFAWDRVIRRFSLYSWYPDWPEFLVRLSMDHRSHPIGRGFTRPAPRNAADAAGIVQEALRETTRKSAEEYPNSRIDGEDSVEGARLSTYAAYADLLFAMADLRRERPSTLPPSAPRSAHVRDPGDSRRATPPPASAFVTTFDVELELALASRHPDRAFVVAVPVNLVEDLEGVELGSTMWIGCAIRPDSDRSILERVTQPPPNAWFLFDTPPVDERRPTLDDMATGLVAEALRGSAERVGDLPIVIRLAGSPLMRLPAIQNDEEGIGPLGQAALIRAQLEGKLDPDRQGEPAWADPQHRGEPVQTRLVHATLLDEHHAIRLSLPEVLEAKGVMPLPAELTGAQGKYWRYWLLLGVEMSDPVIRYRVAAQVLGIGLRGDAEGHQRSRRAGVVFNRRRLNSRALDMLAWCGFDVVVDATAPLPMVAEIQHYVDHLGEHNQRHWPERADHCPLAHVQEEKADR